ncbi:hypothetical protein MNBD_ACTINO01-318, partial [hydrothermal vent metagenome]
MSTVANLPDSMEPLHYLLANAPAQIDATESLADLDALEAELIGKGSPIAQARRGLGAINDPEERRDTGRAINDIASRLTDLLTLRRSELATADESASLAADRVDVTLPGRR